MIPHCSRVGLPLGSKLEEGSEEGSELGEATLGSKLKEGSEEGSELGEIEKEGRVLGKVDGCFEGKGVGSSVGKGVGSSVGLWVSVGVVDGLSKLLVGGCEGSIDMVGKGEAGATLGGTVAIVGKSVGVSVGELVSGNKLMNAV